MKLGYIIIYVPNLEETVSFYEKAFGLKRRFIHESGYAEMETGQTALAFATEELASSNKMSFRPNRKNTPDTPAAEIAFVSDDPVTAYKTALSAGASSIMPPAKKPWGQTVSYVRDLNGFLVELCSPVG